MVKKSTIAWARPSSPFGAEEPLVLDALRSSWISGEFLMSSALSGRLQDLDGRAEQHLRLEWYNRNRSHAAGAEPWRAPE